MAHSSIEWTEQTWNPTTGCTKISQGCKFCYAEIMAKRLKSMGIEKYKNGFKVTLHRDVLDAPKKWRPSVIFVNSMSDLFHENIPLDYIKEVFKVMNDCKQHNFQVLTKRSELLVEYSGQFHWTENIWMGVSVEDAKVMYRIDDLRQCGATIKFLSLEPLLGPLPALNLSGIDWVIVGGESGRKARPIDEGWVIEIRDQCLAANVPFFFKQWGGVNKKVSGRLLEGKVYDGMPRTNRSAAPLAFV